MNASVANLFMLHCYITGSINSIERSERNESQDRSNCSTIEGDVVGTIDSDVLAEELLADIQSQDETEEEEDFTPNNDFCFTEDDFLEARTNMNKATRHAGSYIQTWS